MDKQRNDNFTFTWILKNFSSYNPSSDFCFESPRFAINSLPGSSWFIRLFPREDEHENFVALYLCRDDELPDVCFMRCRFQFMDCNETVFFVCDGKTQKVAANELCRFKRCVNYESVLKYLINDILVIKCYFRSSSETSSSEVLPSLWPNNDLLSDIVLRAGVKTFKVHKAILEARWPKLVKRLRAKRTREQVFDIDANVLEAIIQYVYNGKIDVIENELLEKVYAAAAKYDLPCLKPVPVAQTWQTRVDVEKMSFEWPIHFSSLPKNKVLQLNIFTSIDSNSVWILFFKDCEDIPNGRICLVSLVRREGDKKIFVESKVTYNESGVLKSKHVYETIGIWDCAMFGVRRYITPDGEDVLNVKCEFKFSICNPPEMVKSSCANVFPINCHYFSNNLRDLYESKKLSDVNIRVKSKVFRAHKSILCARSSVFARMFDSDMIESKSNSVRIKDIEPDIMNEFLMFIYSGYLEEPLDDRVEHLYIAADKYDVPALKEKCSAFLKSNLSEQNVCKTLQLADRHYDEDLYKSICEFSAANADKVFSTDEWKDLAKGNLWIKLLRDVAVHNNKNSVKRCTGSPDRILLSWL